MTLDEIYHGMALPGKFKMAISGCHLSCSESWVRDVGLIGQKDGWDLESIRSSQRLWLKVSDGPCGA
jgi:NAD(P)H-nitrite reductase large subunit